MLNFYDFEVFSTLWLVVIINPVEKTKKVIVNDKETLSKYYEEHKEQIWVGYNSRNYDTYILKSILLDFNPKEVNDFIILKGRKGWEYSRLFQSIQLYDYDVATAMQGLKQLEGFMGHNIKETTIPFDLDRKLNPQEIAETIKYCENDVEELIEVFLKRKNDFDAQMDLIKTFKLPLSAISKTKAQLTATILGCSKQKRDDEFNLTFVDTLKLDKYKAVLDWFKNTDNLNYENNLTIDIAGIPHTFGWGGIHGCSNEPIHRKGCLLHIDVTSYYPSLMIEYDFLTRNCKNKSKFKKIYDTRIELKKAGKKKEQAPYKIILNGTYGICKDIYSSAYDPLQANNVCVNGQLLLLDLIEKLEGSCELIQSNTDGLIVQVYEKENLKFIKAICDEWQTRTKMSLSFDIITEIWQGDVNNYVFKFENGKLERKGGYVKELNELDYDLPIVNEAIIKYLTENISVINTINNCNDLIKFQKIVKISKNYKFGVHNGKQLTDRTFRVFASNISSDGSIGKCKDEGATIEKFANTPEHCFILNSDVNQELIPKKLDKRWYIDLAVERLESKFNQVITQQKLF